MVYRTTLTPIFSIRREMDRLFDDAFGDRRTQAVSWTPAMDVREEPAAWHFEVDLPGVSPESVEVNAESGVLTVTAQRRQGTYRRTIELPEGTTSEGITAEYAKGVLTISVPKAETVKARKIEVTVK